MRKAVPPSILTAALMLGSAALANAEFTMEQTIDVMRAAGYVFATESGIDQTARFCAEHYNELQEAAEFSIQAWHARNETVRARSALLSDEVLASVATRSGDAFAIRMRERMEEEARYQARDILSVIEMRPEEERRYICERLLESINEGQWDVSQGNPEAYEILMETGTGGD